MVETRNYIGEFHYTVDSKGRVNLPSKFRNARVDETVFVVTRGLDPCIYVYPLSEWNKMENGLGNLSQLRRPDRTFLRNMTRYATHTTYDAQGRIIVPKVLLDYAKIVKKAIIIGVLNKIEIWSHESLTEYEKSTGNLTDMEYNDLAGEIYL
ncbi:MAG: division/cell wall cluster transcriptional repressor MraZ [Candidatus Marinimicrobia bacterium]|nr:division/cell wall cluster transcriptional repressor MraZ [Candidatus Neomarinimicrobiota bacterium]